MEVLDWVDFIQGEPWLILEGPVIASLQASVSESLQAEDFDSTGLLRGQGYIVKWKDQSYIHRSFIPQNMMLTAQKRFPNGLGFKLKKFLQKQEQANLQVNLLEICQSVSAGMNRLYPLSMQSLASNCNLEWCIMRYSAQSILVSFLVLTWCIRAFPNSLIRVF